MFTDEFIIKSANYYDKKKLAMDTKYNLNKLGINNKGVTQELDTIIAAADAFNMLAVNYMYSFVPEELRILLKVTRVTGAFATSIDGKRFSLNTTIRLHLESGVLDLLFDNKNKCLYTDGFFNKRSDFYKEVSMHINPVPVNFNYCIVIINTNK